MSGMTKADIRDRSETDRGERISIHVYPDERDFAKEMKKDDESWSEYILNFAILRKRCDKLNTADMDELLDELIDEIDD